MKRVLVLLAILLALFGDSPPLQSQAAFNNRNVTFVASTATVGFGQFRNGTTVAVPGGGAQSHFWEIFITGTAPTTVSAVVNGCGVFGTCAGASLVNFTSTSSGTATSSGLFDHFNVVVSWTGGDATTQIQIGSVLAARSPGGSGLPTGLQFVSPTLTVSSAGNGNGQLALSGNTSGTCTFTPSVTSTTVTLNCSAVVPTGSNASPAIIFGGSLSPGLWNNGSSIVFVRNGNATMAIVGAGGTINQASNSGTAGLVEVNGDAVAGAQQLSFQPIGNLGSPIWTVNSTTSGNELGLLRWNTCKINTDISLTVNVINQFCVWNVLPAIAKTWAWTCDIQWAITAGTGTNNFAIGVNASQTPTLTTNGFAQIYTSTTGTQTSASTAISASGDTTLLTGATYTPAATTQFAHTSGTIAASATAGSFAVEATANGTTATAAVKAGTTCMLY